MTDKDNQPGELVLRANTGKEVGKEYALASLKGVIGAVPYLPGSVRERREVIDVALSQEVQDHQAVGVLDADSDVHPPFAVELGHHADESEGRPAPRTSIPCSNGLTPRALSARRGLLDVGEIQ